MSAKTLVAEQQDAPTADELFEEGKRLVLSARRDVGAAWENYMHMRLIVRKK
jgi:hypothetical protein